MDTLQNDKQSLITLYDILIPVFSFAGPLLVYALIQAGTLSPDMQAPLGSAGPFIGSVLLGIYAYILPRRDIVALAAPVYAMVMFWFPSDTAPNLVLQLLFAITLVVLLVRLKLRFSTKKEEKKYLDEDDEDGEPEEPADENLS